MLKIHIDFQCHIHIHKGENLPTGNTENKQEPTTHNPSIPSAVSLKTYAEQQAEQARKQGSFSRARNYRTALHSFLKFREGRDLPLSRITDTLTADYERWLKSCNISMGTVSCYMRSLRSLYNKAVEEGLTDNRFPFAKRYTGCPRTDKRSISSDDIRKLQELPLKHKGYLQLVRDLFLFCFFTCGMPFVDVAFLRKSQIDENGYLTYYRRKTHQPIRLHLIPSAREIIRRYQSETSDYVFPILTQTEPEKAYKQYKEKLCYYNKLLRELGRQAGIPHKLTSYVSRHSWASLAYEADTEMSVISKGLGHTSPRTTLIYIKGIDDTRLDDANQKIFRKILTNNGGIKSSNSVQEV